MVPEGHTEREKERARGVLQQRRKKCSAGDRRRQLTTGSTWSHGANEKQAEQGLYAQPTPRRACVSASVPCGASIGSKNSQTAHARPCGVAARRQHASTIKRGGMMGITAMEGPCQGCGSDDGISSGLQTNQALRKHVPLSATHGLIRRSSLACRGARFDWSLAVQGSGLD